MTDPETPRTFPLTGSAIPPRGSDDDGDASIAVKTRAKTQRPPLYKVLLLNDDYTPMEFVVHVLERFFGMTHAQAFEVMLTVHKKGVAVVGVFSHEIAETKVGQVMDFARRHQHPLQCTMEKEQAPAPVPLSLMSSPRLSYALTAGGLALPSDGTVVLYGAPGDADAPVDAARLHITQGFRPDVEAWEARGLPVSPSLPDAAAAVIVTLPRARDLAEDRIARAAALARDLVVVDGAKTDGIEAIAKALRGRVELLGQVSKAHGKCLWFRPTDALSDWIRPAFTETPEGVTAPGVFSADGADPASVALAAALPETLKGRVADHGAGWGWLSREILKRPGVTALDMVEADHAALACARRNVTDPRAAFHWADATTWAPEAPLDAVVMNPPFHVGRRADPALGRAFVAAAARVLAPHGRLWLVANRHLPYETALDALFRDTTEVGGDSRFKILHAARKRR